jgi:hypothetical protein
MTPQQIVAVCVRLFSIWLLILIPSFYLMLELIQANTGPYGWFSGVWMKFLVIALVLAIALLLWRFPMFITHKVLPATTAEFDAPSATAKQLAEAGSFLLGRSCKTQAVIQSHLETRCVVAFWGQQATAIDPKTRLGTSCKTLSDVGVCLNYEVYAVQWWHETNQPCPNL